MIVPFTVALKHKSSLDTLWVLVGSAAHAMHTHTHNYFCMHAHVRMDAQTARAHTCRAIHGSSPIPTCDCTIPHNRQCQIYSKTLSVLPQTLLAWTLLHPDFNYHLELPASISLLVSHCETELTDLGQRQVSWMGKGFLLAINGIGIQWLMKLR